MNDDTLDEQVRSTARFSDRQVGELDLGAAEAELLSAVLAAPHGRTATRSMADDNLQVVPIELAPGPAVDRRRSRRTIAWTALAAAAAAALVASVLGAARPRSERVTVRDPGVNVSPPRSTAASAPFATEAAAPPAPPPLRVPPTTVLPTAVPPTTARAAVADPTVPAADPTTTVLEPVPDLPAPTSSVTDGPADQGLVEPQPAGVLVDLPIRPLAGSFNFVSVSTGSELLVWSPVDGKGVALDPVTRVTRPIVALPFDVASAVGAGWAPVGGRAFVWAGTSAAVYDPANDRWSAALPLPEPRSGSLTVAVGGRVVIWGGNRAGGLDPPALEALVWTASTGSWTRSSPAPSGRGALMSAAVLGDVVYLAGGSGGSENAPILAFHTPDASWSELPPPVALPYEPFIVADGSNLLALALDHSVSAVFDPATGSWTTSIPTMPIDHGRHPAYAVAIGAGSLYDSGYGRVYVHRSSGWRSAFPLPLGGEGLFLIAGHVVVPGTTTGSVATWGAAAYIVPPENMPPT